MHRVDARQQEQATEAAEKFANALKGSYRSLADRSVSAQELDAQLTQDFFNGVIKNLRTRAGGNRALADGLIAQQHKQRGGASQALAQGGERLHGLPQLHVFLLPGQPRRGPEAGQPVEGPSLRSVKGPGRHGPGLSI